MICDDFRDRLSAYHDRELPAADEAVIGSHLARCAACTRELLLIEQASSLARGVFEDTAADVLAVPASLRQAGLASAERRGRVLRAAGIVVPAVAATIIVCLMLKSAPPAKPQQPAVEPSLEQATKLVMGSDVWVQIDVGGLADNPMVRMFFRGDVPAPRIVVGPGHRFLLETTGMLMGMVPGDLPFEPLPQGAVGRIGCDGKHVWRYVDGQPKVRVLDRADSPEAKQFDQRFADLGIGDSPMALLGWSQLQGALAAAHARPLDFHQRRAKLNGEDVTIYKVEAEADSRPGPRLMMAPRIAVGDDGMIRQVDAGPLKFMIKRLDAAPDASSFDWHRYAGADVQVEKVEPPARPDSRDH